MTGGGAIRLRRATAADAAALAEGVIAGVADYPSFAPPGWAAPPLDAEVEHARELLADADVHCLVAESDGEIVGQITVLPARRAPHPIDTPTLAHVSNLIVRRDFWGAGLARDLHRAALDAARGRGFTELRLFVAEGQGRARRFYEREGWLAAGDPFDDPIPGLTMVEYRRALADHSIAIRDGRLHVEGCDATKLARRHGTPCYVVSDAQLRANARRIGAAFAAAWPHGPVAVLAAFKAAPSLAIRAILNDEGLGCDAFGGPELRAALRAGVPGERISLNGPRKDAATLALAVEAGATVTLDAPEELEALRAAVAQAGRPARVHLRLRPDYTRITAPSDFSAGGASVAEAAHAYKPGVPPEQAGALAAAIVAEPGVELTGLMAHLGRHRADLDTWALMATSVAQSVGELVAALEGWAPRELSVGGGFPTPRDPIGRAPGDDGSLAPRAPSIEAIAGTIGDALGRGLAAAGVPLDGLLLRVEPGRSLHADTGIHLTTIQGVKRTSARTARTWLECDTSEQFLLDTIVEGNRWPVVVAARADAPPAQRADLVGCSCGFDVLVADAALPEVAPGDVVALLDTGAYQESLATNFNALPRPATVLVSGERSEVIRRREREEEVFARDVVPARFGGPAPAHVSGEIDHVSVTCASIDRSLAFYRDGLGLAVSRRGADADERIGAVVGLPGAQLRFAELALGEGRLLELLEYESPTGRVLRPQPNDAGAAHFALAVTDLDGALRRLRDHGFPSRSAPVTLHDHEEPWTNATIAYVDDPDGFVIELIQRPR
jgi:diaminopimelate decarboxylase